MEVDVVGGAKAIIDDEDAALVVGRIWRLDYHGYVVTSGRGSRHIPLHRLVNRTPPGYLTDHIDRDKLNNRRSNLRIANKSLNSLNSKTHSRNRSGYRGVSLHNPSGLWRATIVINGKQESLGYFHEPAEASASYENRRLQAMREAEISLADSFQFVSEVVTSTERKA